RRERLVPQVREPVEGGARLSQAREGREPVTESAGRPERSRKRANDPVEIGKKRGGNADRARGRAAREAARSARFDPRRKRPRIMAPMTPKTLPAPARPIADVRTIRLLLEQDRGWSV